MSHGRNYIADLCDELHGNRAAHTPSLSQRRQSAIHDQRIANGDLRPNQRSLNDGS